MSTSFSVASCTEQMTLPFLNVSQKFMMRWQNYGGAGPILRHFGWEDLRGIDSFEGLAFNSIDEFVVDEQSSSNNKFLLSGM